MSLDYDPVKAAANLRKHGVAFADAEGVFFDPMAITLEDLASVQERRFVTIGMGSTGDILVAVYTHRGETIRLISARRATKKERKTYEG